MVELALYQPDIPQNMGAIMRLCAAMGLPLHVIEPCGFPLDDRRLRRVAMDYYEAVQWQRHVSWEHFCERCAKKGQRIVLLTTKSSDSYYEFEFRADDILLFGRESAGVPEEVHARVDARLTIPMRTGMRSLNLALSAAMVTGEAVRQVSLVNLNSG